MMVLSMVYSTAQAFAYVFAKQKPENYKNQNLLLNKRTHGEASMKVNVSSKTSTNPLTNSANYKANVVQDVAKTKQVSVNSVSKPQNYKQQNLLLKK